MTSNYEAMIKEMNLYTQAVGYSQGSQKAIEVGIKVFLKWLEKEGIKDIKKVKRKEIKNYHEHLKNRANKIFEGGLSSSTIAGYLWMVCILFSYLEQSDKLQVNPMSGYRLPKVTSKKRTILSLLEIEQLYEAVDTEKERVILHLFYGLGLRRSEGLALNIKDISLKKGWLYVLKGKGGKGRNIPMPKQIQEDLKNYILQERPQTKSPALLVNRYKKRMRGYTALQTLRVLLKRASLNEKIDLHCLRHSIATHLINSGMPLEQVRDYLGHACLESTQKYIHYDTKRVFKSTL